QYELGGLDMQVTISPASALVSINNAEAPLLEALLRHASALSDGEAAELAAAIIEWRSGTQTDATGRPVFTDDGRGPFLVDEELLEVPGMNRDIYEAVRPWIHTQVQAIAEL